MTTYYLDASALVKNYVKEFGSTWVRQIVAAGESNIVTGTLSLPEVGAAFAILARTGRLTKREGREVFDLFFDDINKLITVAEVTLSIAMAAANLTQRYPLKGYDAVHLATALSLARDLYTGGLASTLVTGDDQMIRAARSEGLPIANPFDYAHLDHSEATQ